MNIYIDYQNENYSNKNRKLGNCVTIEENNETYLYEFSINKNEASIKYNNIKYIQYAVDEYRKHNPYITIFFDEKRTFYKSFDPYFTFKLPIKCIQPSKFFVSEDTLNNLEEYLDENDEIFIPVAIINDEYVCLDGHARLLYLHQNYEKLVNVYIYPYSDYVTDFIYLAKENNILNVSNIKILPNEQYEAQWLQFINDYFEI